jgi:hydrogenase expression/formation protein HypD
VLFRSPGCPVCVTPVSFVDAAVEIAGREGVITASFGDLLKVPGSGSSLAAEKAGGADVRIVSSPLDALELAAENPGKKVVFLSVGFETTAPVSALTVLKAHENDIRNFSMLSANKTMPEALKLLVKDGDSSAEKGDASAKPDGFLYPGHVSAITGTAMYEELAADFGIPGVIAGFEPLDILHAIITLAGIIRRRENRVVNEYSRVVRKEGNPAAIKKLYEVFEPCSAVWRGLGEVKGSGLKIREKYERFDAWKVFGVELPEGKEPPGCLCAEVLKGRAAPDECGLFGVTCTPGTPVGACMVSSEGTCAAYYRFGRRIDGCGIV